MSGQSLRAFMEEQSMNKEHDILFIGMINLNLSIGPVDQGIFTKDVSLIGPVKANPGGDAMNEALTAARLSNKVALVGLVGNDLFGRYVIDEAKSAGVSTEHIRISQTATTAVAAMMIDKKGDRNICAYRGSIEEFSENDIDMTLLERSKIINIGSMFALKKFDGDSMRRILQRGKEAGAITGSDVKQDIYNLGFEGVKQTLPYIDYFLPSYDEAKYMTGETDPARQSDFLRRAGCATVVIKLGGDGCYISTASKGKTIPPCPAIRVDTSGAGDNFVAGFLTGINRGWEPEEAARFGNATAAISIQEYGSNGAVKSFDQVIEYIKTTNY
jgi:sugar/nucleoside kinase (ribokinase family)